MASGEDVEEVDTAVSKASTEVVEEVGKKIDRHCGFCLTLIPGEEVKGKTCSKCKRRAYCSQECQKADWKATPTAPAFNGTIYGYGQGHKNWCGLPYGEEDLDWKVVPISGKGLGIVALRDIPPLYRIMVDGMQHQPEGIRYADPAGSSPRFHSAMNDLHPANSDISTKFVQNHEFTPARGMKLGLRFSRMNHSCRPNAAYDVDHPIQNLAVFMVYSEREIKAGEEICRSYMQGDNFPFQGGFKIREAVLTHYKTPEECREEYSSKWGFVCPPSCPCRGERNEQLHEELKEMGKYCVANPLKKPALEKFQKIIEEAKQFGVGPMKMITFHMLAYELAVTRRQTLDQAKKHLQTVQDMIAAVVHPNAVSLCQGNPALTGISNHPQYLAAER